ncbi:hypothetical protein KUCAC02_000373 [Chaenocephalus aceratus]|uniref:Uncharacterized protein n=1 Tax=Chaenocephalus aceratus TaxID=36190 RepID=A0ACB9W663_CHAAC|nr:hypothetical protein KUCAC02_000373 [Chaenocephalus aceratus]
MGFGSLSAVYAVWMYQIQYNCTADETLIYRILPSTSDRFLLKNLVSGADYNLCVLAIFDDTITSLAATKVLGCATFSTKDVYPACRSLHAHFLGGTLTILVGGVVVVTLLVFTVALMVRHPRLQSWRPHDVSQREHRGGGRGLLSGWRERGQRGKQWWVLPIEWIWGRDDGGPAQWAAVQERRGEGQGEGQGEGEGEGEGRG